MLERARQAFDAGDDTLVEAIARQVGTRAGEVPELLVLAGAAAERQGRQTDALAYYDQVPDDAGGQSLRAREAAGDLWLKRGQPSEAESKYRQALAIDRASLPVRDRLARLLVTEGRIFESLPHLYELLRHGQNSRELLLLAGAHDKTLEAPDDLTRWRAAAPDDPGPAIGLARIALAAGKPDEATQLLREAIANGPDYIEAHALLGRIILESADEAKLAAWNAGLPDGADEHPDIWAVRAGWAKRQGRLQAAARGYWEALRRDANHQIATLQLSQLLNALGRDQVADLLAQRARALAEFSTALNLLFLHPGDIGLLFRAARLAETLGRLWEARGWNQRALAVAADADWACDALARIEPRLDDVPPPTLPNVDPGLLLDLSEYPLPDRLTEPKAGSVAASPVSHAPPRFAERARELGINFTYYCGRDGSAPRDRMFQSLGGGAAALDFDLDGWPDLYFTQGCRWPPQAGQTEFLDAMYRNLAGYRFADVTAASGLGDERFSQGATVGDFDNDGFPDLYVANIGVNRLYHNNGDGTFSDVGHLAGITDDRWTTSCLLADVNGDGLPDIYDVNYLEGPDVYEKTCAINGLPQTCTPTLFQPAPDTFYLNLGDGRFEEMTEAAGLRPAGGNGLGLLACDFSGTGKLNLFVANDQDANFYFVNQTRAAGAPRFIEQGLLSGLAYNGEGNAFASMGVAAGDVNGDGRIDLLVTNFSHESSTLYLQDGPDSFTDATGPSGLRKPSYPMLGFGAQFIDAELDGLLDLVVTNGHVHEFSSPGVSYAMRPQYFRNLGAGRFEELTADAVGDYFSRPCFGRGLVRLDFNRDGLDDFAVSALETPAALVANETEHAGHFLTVELRGVRSSRDAIGASVTCQTGDRLQTRWLTAGDGFHASNERRLTFSAGAADRVDRLSITWPSGLVQHLAGIPVDQQIVVIEGAPDFAALPPEKPVYPQKHITRRPE